MSNITDPTAQQTAASGAPATASPTGKGKEKAPIDEPMEEDEEEEEEDDDDDDEEEEEMEDDDEEEELAEIDPSAIVGRRTRGVRVDYTSKEALAKAGFTGNEMDEDDEEEMK